MDVPGVTCPTPFSYCSRSIPICRPPESPFATFFRRHQSLKAPEISSRPSDCIRIFFSHRMISNRLDRPIIKHVSFTGFLFVLEKKNCTLTIPAQSSFDEQVSAGLPFPCSPPDSLPLPSSAATIELIAARTRMIENLIVYEISN